MRDAGGALATRLRQETESLHRQAERSGYINVILRKQATREGYALFLRNLAPAYAALEAALEGDADDAVQGLFDWPPLFRQKAIAADLTAISGPAWQDLLPVLNEANAYADRIEHIRLDAPHRLLGHAYVRYIGDLSGGQIVKALLVKEPGLEARMLGFYDFPGIADAEAYKEKFREGLDQAGDMTSDLGDIVDEAMIAFQLNIDLSMAVGLEAASMSPCG